MNIEAKFNEVEIKSKKMLVCTIKGTPTPTVLEKVYQSLRQVGPGSIFVCDESFRFYNVESDCIILIKPEEEKQVESCEKVLWYQKVFKRNKP